MLYGKSSTGAIKQWAIYVQEYADYSTITVEYGLVDGKLQQSVQKASCGKNIGRSNETTHYEQAVAEAESKWKKQKDKNYVEDMEQLSSAKEMKILPMLAQKYGERSQYITWPAYVQPKLNGVRCLVQRVGNEIFYWSRKSKPYKNFKLYMDQMFLSFMKDGEILDGEMYNHGEITFQKLISLIKDEKTPDVQSLKKYVKFHCYDRAVLDGGFEQRYLHWKNNLPNGLNTPYLTFVKTVEVDEEKTMKLLHGIFIEGGYEGTIIRSHSDEPYRFQYRDNQLQKYKDFDDDEFLIVGCKDGKGKDEHKAIFRCQSSSRTGGSYGDGTFDVRCKGTMEERENQWNNRKQYIGKQLTVRYQTLSDEQIPIFPVGIAIRDYEGSHE